FRLAFPRDGKGCSSGRMQDNAPAMATDLGAVVRDTCARVGRSATQLPQHVRQARVRRWPQAFAAQEPAQEIRGSSIRQACQMGAIQPDVIDTTLGVERAKLVK